MKMLRTGLATAVLLASVAAGADLELSTETFTARLPGAPTHQSSGWADVWVCELDGARYQLKVIAVLRPEDAEERQLSDSLFTGGPSLVDPKTAKWLTLQFPGEQHPALEVGVNAGRAVGRLRAFIIDRKQYELSVMAPVGAQAGAASRFFDGFVHRRAGQAKAVPRAPWSSRSTAPPPKSTLPPLPPLRLGPPGPSPPMPPLEPGTPPLVAAPAPSPVAAPAPSPVTAPAPSPVTAPAPPSAPPPTALAGVKELPVQLRTARDFFGMTVVLANTGEVALGGCELRLPTGVAYRFAAQEQARPREELKIPLGNFTPDRGPGDPLFASGYAKLSCRGASGYARFTQ